MAAVKDHIDILKKAQVLDREVYLAEQALQDIPEEREQLKSQLEGEKAQLRELENVLKETQLNQKNKEGELAEKENNIKKLDGQLSQLKTNKEYSAMQQEIASLKADNSILEEEIIKMLDSVEAAGEEVKKETERLKEVEKEYAQREADLSAKEKQAKETVDNLKNDRVAVLDQLPPDVKDLYNAIVTKKEGMALAKVVNENCSACHMKIRPQVMNDIRLSKTFVQCESCSRILYFDDEEPSAE